MDKQAAAPLVHLELHTVNLSRACAFYTRLFGWHAERVAAGGGSYVSLGVGGSIEGGVVECETHSALWLPYVEVPEIHAATERARELGAAVALEPREGPAGWRSVIRAPAAGELGLWQPKA